MRKEDKTHHGVAVVTAENDDVDGGGVVGHANASSSRPILPALEKNHNEEIS